jgi:probable rRNA maturation factor
MDDNVSVQISENFLTIIDPEKVRNAVTEVINYAAASNQVSLTVAFESDETLQQLNNQYLGIDAPTDVLAFPADYVDPETGTQYLGDILISVPQALIQAASGDHPIEDELQLLVVHGTLHLLGYDHMETNEKEHMQAAQSAILHQLGIELKVIL